METLTRLDLDAAWDEMRGMSWAWDYCATGTGANNAPGLQGWFERRGYRVSLKNCAKLSSMVQASNRDPWSAGVGGKAGQTSL
jgi:hypothetical protein